MKRMIQKRFLLLAFGALFILHACQKEDEFSSPQISGEAKQPSLKASNSNTFYGPTRPIGEGVARAWISMSKSGTMLAVGVNLSELALESLPDEPVTLVLPIPTRKGASFYTHALVDWNPQGHEPPGVYDVPHFDFHFYTVTNAARMAIGPLAPPAYDLAPEADFIPPMYMQTPGVVPAMGAHWVDLLAPEFNGEPFTKTFIWGSYNGEFIFWEPMITLDYLLTRPDDEVVLRQPDYYARTGWYPQKFKLGWSEQGHFYSIALMDLTFVEAMDKE